MKTSQGFVFQSLRAASAFIDANAAELTDVVDTGARKRLADAIVALAAHVDDQSGSQLKSQGLTERQRILRIELHDHMRAIARVARADLPNTPEFRPLRMPRGGLTTERLKAAATGMAQVAAEHVSVFMAAGLPKDFIDQLTTAAQAILGTVDERKVTHGKRSGATAGLARELVEGKRVLAILDALVTRALRTNAPLLANWKTVIHTRRGVASATASTPVAEPTPSATSVAA